MKVYRCKICRATRSKDGVLFKVDESNPLTKMRIILHIIQKHLELLKGRKPEDFIEIVEIED